MWLGEYDAMLMVSSLNALITCVHRQSRQSSCSSAPEPVRYSYVFNTSELVEASLNVCISPLARGVEKWDTAEMFNRDYSSLQNLQLFAEHKAWVVFLCFDT